MKPETSMIAKFAAARVAACLAAALVAAVAPAAAQTKESTEPTLANPGTGAVTTPSGLVFRTMREGSGASPTAADKVTVHYRGTLTDGREFDSSYKRGQPATFPLGKVIPCWTEGLQRMRVGGKAMFMCPASIAYGERGAGTVIPPNATLLFEVELLDIVPTR
jgi:FKBP-type peptidyl-prolyl cis-trans isomerase FkpA